MDACSKVERQYAIWKAAALWLTGGKTLTEETKKNQLSELTFSEGRIEQ